MMYFLIYIIKSTLCLTIFYLFFKVLLSKETFFRFNRLVLLGGMIVCAILPLINYKTSTITFIQAPVAKIESFFIPEVPSELSTIVLSDDFLPEPVVEVPSNPVEYPVEDSFEFSIQPQDVAVYLYSTGFLVTALLLFFSVFKMIRIIRNGERVKDEKNTIVLSLLKICPFSWGNYIVLNKNDYLQHPEEILTHERVHVHSRHSFDLAFAELFILFHWFNPVVWLLKKELQDVHEYEADMGVIKQGIDATKYQLLLVKKAVGARSYAIANSFNHSKIKNRITMMLKEKSARWARLKLVLFVPLAAVALQALAHPEVTSKNESLLIGSEGTTILPESEGKTDVYLTSDSVPPPPPLPRDAKKNKPVHYTPPVIVKDGDSVAPPPPPLPKSNKKEKQFSYKNDEEKMTAKEKAATKEFEVAAQKFSSIMEDFSSNMDNIVNSKEIQALTNEFEAASKKFEVKMREMHLNFENGANKNMEALSKKFEAEAQKFEKIMQKNESELKAGTESSEVKAAKEEFKAASEIFKKNMSQLNTELKQMQESPEMKAAQKEFEVAGEKYKQGMSQVKSNIKNIENDPKMKAAKAEFEAASQKYQEAMKDYHERLKENI